MLYGRNQNKIGKQFYDEWVLNPYLNILKNDPQYENYRNKYKSTLKNGTAFDEEKFFKSLKKQADSGAALSEKQLAALKRMAVKYQAQLTDKAKVFELLQIDSADDAVENDAAASRITPVQIGDLIAALNQVTEWAPAEKKGRFTFDDKKFFQSLARHYSEKKSLSEKQSAALEKLAAKYLNPEK